MSFSNGRPAYGLFASRQIGRGEILGNPCNHPLTCQGSMWVRWSSTSTSTLWESRRGLRLVLPWWRRVRHIPPHPFVLTMMSAHFTHIHFLLFIPPPPPPLPFSSSVSVPLHTRFGCVLTPSGLPPRARLLLQVGGGRVSPCLLLIPSPVLCYICCICSPFPFALIFSLVVDAKKHRNHLAFCNDYRSFNGQPNRRQVSVPTTTFLIVEYGIP
jgi:hypothetical protein